MSPNRDETDVSIGQLAEVEKWRCVRHEARRRLTVSATVGVLYVLAALAVGTFLVLTVAEAASLAMDRRGSGQAEPDMIRSIAWIYGVIGLVAIAVYFAAMALIRDWLPSGLYPLVSSMPWVGSTIRAVVLGEFCQSIYQSIAGNQTYRAALAEASRTISNSAFRQWSLESSQRLEAGQSLEYILPSAPSQDHPLVATTALIADHPSARDSAWLWHEAASECHRLAQSRVERTTSVVSVLCVLASAMIAAFAVFLTVRVSVGMLDGLYY